MQSKRFIKLLEIFTPHCIHVCFNINMFKITYCGNMFPTVLVREKINGLETITLGKLS